MRPAVLTTIAVGAGLLGCAAVWGCGGDDDGAPGEDVVARVGETEITKADFERALRFAAGRANDPRDFAACAAAKQRQGDGKDMAEAQLVEQCKAEYAQLKRIVMDYLIKAEWTRQEAEARDVALSDAEIGQAVAQARQGGFLDSERLKDAGVTEQQVLVRIRQNRLQLKLTEQITAPSREISSEEIADYYRVNRTELAVPNRRDIRIVITRARARALAAKAALENGRSWETVAREYSVHLLSRASGGRITNARKGESDEGLGAAIFRAGKGQLTGPVRDDDTWAVFVVDKIKPAYQPTLAQARDEVRDRLRSGRERRALEAYTERYRAATTCAPGFRIPACKNGPPGEEPSA
jgi:foldase protein PrsA